MNWKEERSDKFNEINEHTPEPKKKRRYGLAGTDAEAEDSRDSNGFAAKSLSLCPTSSSSSMPLARNYERQSSQGSISVRNRFNNTVVPEEKVNTPYA